MKRIRIFFDENKTGHQIHVHGLKLTELTEVLQRIAKCLDARLEEELPTVAKKTETLLKKIEDKQNERKTNVSTTP